MPQFLLEIYPGSSFDPDDLKFEIARPQKMLRPKHNCIKFTYFSYKITRLSHNLNWIPCTLYKNNTKAIELHNCSCFLLNWDVMWYYPIWARCKHILLSFDRLRAVDTIDHFPAKKAKKGEIPDILDFFPTFSLEKSKVINNLGGDYSSLVTLS